MMHTYLFTGCSVIFFTAVYYAFEFLILHSIAISRLVTIVYHCYEYDNIAD